MKAMIFCGNPASAAEVVAALHLRWPDLKSLVACQGKRDAQIVVQYGPDIVVVRDDGPRLDAWSAMEEVRLISDVPMVVVSESDDPMDVVKALSLGADDYVAMPRDFTVLIARVVAVLRRVGVSTFGPETPIVRCGELAMNPGDRAVFLGSERVMLTDPEFRLLSLLLENPLVTLPGEYMQRVLWGDRGETNQLKKYIQRLRYKLSDDPQQPRWIRTVHGIGYRFLVPQTAPVAAD